jgi:uncharacterized protein (DUF433 family)
MTISLQADPPPLRIDEQGAVRVGNSRVTLDVLIEEYEGGASPEAIVRAFDTLEKADVYAALAYYLRHQDEVKAYLRRREAEAVEIQRKLEAAGMTWPGARETLSARRAQGEHDDHASSRH